jgi:hypothetical protein
MNCVLATSEMTERQTGLNIKEKLDEVLDEFGLHHDNNYFVTDNARNMISACNERERYSCCGHNLNLVLKNTFSDSNEVIKNIKENMDKVKIVVTLMKRKGLMRKFAEKHKSIPQEVETRFNSKFQMIKVFSDMFENLKTFSLIDKELQISLLSVNEEILKEILPLLEILNTSTQYISQNTVPTVHAVILIKRRILAQLEVEETDNEIIKILKETLKQNVEKYFKIHLIHKIAIFFDPKLKDLKLLDENERKEVIESLTQTMRSLTSQSHDGSQQIQSQEQVVKKRKLTNFEESLYDTIEENETTNEDEIQTEIEFYSKAVISANESFDLLKFWFKYSTTYPNISRLAKIILSLPATQFESERNFSLSGRTLEPRRCRLLPENVDYLLFIKSNYE